MYNIKFTFADGREIYPNYLDADGRRKLRNEIGQQSQVMWCSCRSDIKLYYRISENLHFYPEHQGYVHSPYCIRYQAAEEKRRSAIMFTDEQTATVFLKFKPQNFTIPSESPGDDELDEDSEDNLQNIDTSTSNDESEENEMLHLSQQKVDSDEFKEPKFNLSSFIRCINHDTFSDRAINGKPILSKEYFMSAIMGRLKYIRISGYRKSVRSLTLEEDGVRFFYAPYEGCEKKIDNSKVSYHIRVRGADNKVYSLFTFGKIYEKALNQFHRQYGFEPNDRTMVAGFQNYPKSRMGKHYKVVGRLHLFQVSDHGIYCNTQLEAFWYNLICYYIRKNSFMKMRFYIPVEDEIINGVIEIEQCVKKGLIIFPSTKQAKNYSPDRSRYEVLMLGPDVPLSEAVIKSLIERLLQSRQT